METQLLPRAVKWIVNAAFQGALDGSVDRYFAWSLENKFARIDDLFAHQLFCGHNESDRYDHRRAHQMAAQEVYSLGKDGLRYLGNLREILREPHHEAPKGREWAILSIRNQGLDGVPALADIAKLSTYWSPYNTVEENIGVRHEAMRTVGSIGKLAIESGDERFFCHVRDALPHLVRAFAAIAGNADPDTGSRMSALTTFGELGASAIRGGNRPLISLFAEQLDELDDSLGKDAHVLVRAAAIEALEAINGASLAVVAGDRALSSKGHGGYAHT